MSGSAPGGEEVSGTGEGPGRRQREGAVMHLMRGVAAITLKAFNEMVNTSSYAASPFNPDILLIDSGSEMRLCWNQDMFTDMKACDLKQFST